MLILIRIKKKKVFFFVEMDPLAVNESTMMMVTIKCFFVEMDHFIVNESTR